MKRLLIIFMVIPFLIGIGWASYKIESVNQSLHLTDGFTRWQVFILSLGYIFFFEQCFQALKIIYNLIKIRLYGYEEDRQFIKRTRAMGDAANEALKALENFKPPMRIVPPPPDKVRK